jgi:hypothetical protein
MTTTTQDPPTTTGQDTETLDTETVEESSGQQALAGPGLERRFDLKITGPEPDGAKLKLKGGANVAWEGPELQRRDRITLVVEAIVTGVGVEDDTDNDGNVKDTWRVHIAEVEDIRPADDDEGIRLAAARFRRSGEPREQGQPPSPHGDPREPDTADDDEQPDEPEAREPVEMRADEVEIGDSIVSPEDGELRGVWDRAGGGENPVRLILDGEGGEALEMAPDETVRAVRSPRADDDDIRDFDSDDTADS